MSHATIAISARTQRMKFGTLAYSALQCSAKCLPKITKQHIKRKEEKKADKQITGGIHTVKSRLPYHLPVTTPRLAARD